MASVNSVMFFQLLQEDYDNITTPDPYTLYFLTDTKRIYLGDTCFSQGKDEHDISQDTVDKIEIQINTSSETITDVATGQSTTYTNDVITDVSGDWSTTSANTYVITATQGKNLQREIEKVLAAKNITSGSGSSSGSIGSNVEVKDLADNAVQVAKSTINNKTTYTVSLKIANKTNHILLKQDQGGLYIDADDIDNAIDQAQSAAQAATTLVQDAANDLDDLRTKVQIASDKADSAKTSADAVGNQLSTIQSTVSSNTQRIGTLENDVSNINNKLDSIDNDVASAKDASDKAKDAADKAQAAADKLTNDLDLDTLNAKIDAATTAANTANTNANDALSKVNKIDDLESKVNDASTKANTANTNASEALTKASNAEDSVTSLAQQVQTNTSDIATLKSQTSKNTSDISNLNTNISTTVKNEITKQGSTIKQEIQQSIVQSISDGKILSVDQEFNGNSSNAQSGVAIQDALNTLKSDLEGSGSNITVDQDYNATSENPQSGTAVAQAIANVKGVTWQGTTNNVKFVKTTSSDTTTYDDNTIVFITE